jgi:predicted nucleic acid-binding protein
VITVAEIHVGLREHESEKTDDFPDSLNIVEVNARIARKAGQYKREGKSRKLELDDCIIAASAFDLGALLATGNGKLYPMEDIDKTIVSTG